MHPDDYKHLVGRLEAISQQNPAALRWRVIGLIALGYAYVLTILFAAAGLGILLLFAVVFAHSGGLAIRLGIPLLVFAWLVLKSLWIKLTPPGGVLLTAGEAPALEARVEEIRAALAAPPVDAILLTADFNASVTQIPRFGIFGWPKTYLSLGLPLMLGLTPRQFDATLAHEFAHLSGDHPKWGLWVYRMSRTWQQLLEHLQHARSWGSRLFEWFVRWYVPRLRAHGFVLSRRDEYAADADAARITDAAAMSQTLVATELRGRVVERFWTDVWRRAQSDATPPDITWSTMPLVLKGEIPASTRVEWLGRALTRRATADDTHPSLAERLAALGTPDAGPEAAHALAERMIPPIESSAAERYLGGLASTLINGFESDWRNSVGEVWESQHKELTAHLARIDEIRSHTSGGATLTSEESWELARRLSETDRDQEAIPLLRALIAAQPAHVGAHFMLGRTMVGMGDSDGAAHIRRAMMLDAAAIPAGVEILRWHYVSCNDRDGLRDVDRLLYEHHEQVHRIAVERTHVSKRDVLVDAGLGAADLEKLRSAADAEPKITRLWSVKKVTHVATDGLLVIVAERRWWRLGTWRASTDQQLAERLASTIHLSVSTSFIVIVINGRTAWLRKRVLRMPAALVFARAK